jgi:uncharacterized membrane protein
MPAGRQLRGANTDVPAPGRSWPASLLTGQSGAVLVLVVAFLPVLVAAMALVVETGRLFVLARWAQAAADLGALAGAQEVDLEQLADGERYLDEERARLAADRITTDNLRDLGGVVGSSRVQVYVINVAEGPTIHPRTGRFIRDPTVSVWVEVSVPVHLVWWTHQVRLAAHADASVVEKRSSRR